MAWSLPLDKEREWPAKHMVGELSFRDPTLRDMRALPEIEEVRTYPDRSSVYAVKWDAVDAWLSELVRPEEHRGLIGQLTPAEATRAKDRLLGFFAPAAAATPRSAPPTTSDSEPASDRIRIE